MKNDADNIYFGRDFCRSAFLLIAFLISFPVFSADGLPPPNSSYVQNSGSPVDRNLERMGYDHSTNTLRVNYSSSGGTNYSSVGGAINGNTRVNATITDSYGATARGQITTTTKIPSSTLNKAVGTYVGGSLVGSVINSQHAQNAASQIGQGNYTEGALSAAASFDVFGIGSGLNALKDAFVQAQNQKTAGFVQRHQSLGEAALQNQGHQFVQLVFWNHYPTQGNQYSAGSSELIGIFPSGVTVHYLGDVVEIRKAGNTVLATVHNKNKSDQGMLVYTKQVQNEPSLYQESYTAEQIMLTQLEMQNVILSALADQGSALNTNTAALTELVNALHASGGINASETTTTINNGGTAATTFLTAPYTPQGSNQAQQTQFVINKDGSVTATTITRPDLAANTSQAPTRAPVGVQQTAPDTKPAKESATASAPDVCANNPNSLMCAPLGNMDYSDPVLPEKAINISLNPLNVFSTSGVCPNPLSFTLLHTNHQFSYETMCDVAAKARPWIIMLSMLFAFTLVYYALGFGQR